VVLWRLGLPPDRALSLASLLSRIDSASFILFSVLAFIFIIFEALPRYSFWTAAEEVEKVVVLCAVVGFETFWIWTALFALRRVCWELLALTTAFLDCTRDAGCSADLRSADLS